MMHEQIRVVPPGATPIGPLMQRSAGAARKLWARAVERLQHDLEGPP